MGTGATRNQINFKGLKGVDLRERTVHGRVVQKLVNANIGLDVNQSIKIIFIFLIYNFFDCLLFTLAQSLRTNNKNRKPH